jgi:hypothetical protein
MRCKPAALSRRFTANTASVQPFLLLALFACNSLFQPVIAPSDYGRNFARSVRA